MTKFDEAVNWERSYLEEQVASLCKARVVAEKLGLSNANISDVSMEQTREIRITAWDVEGLQALVTKLLPFTKTVKKSFHERFKQFQFAGEYEGVKIVISMNPPNTCTIESYEEEKRVPAQEFVAAHTQTVTRFRPAGDCLPVMDVPTKIEELEQDA